MYHLTQNFFANLTQMYICSFLFLELILTCIGQRNKTNNKKKTLNSAVPKL